MAAKLAPPLEGSSTPQVRLQVEDSGIGIPPEHLDKLFQPLIQIDGALNRQYAGTGLGLALVKGILQLHQGEVGVTSQVGKGSLFGVDLPLAPESISPQSASTASAHPFPAAEVITDIQPPLILLAEDNEANISTISSYLGAKGYHLSIARNGQEAVTKIADENPDLVLMDIQMPEMDGIEAIQYVRQVLQNTALPIVALTALAMDEDRERCLTAGANAYLSKPVRLKELVTMIQGLLSGDLS